MQQAQKMQQTLQRAQEELAKLEVTGSAGGSMVRDPQRYQRASRSKYVLTPAY